MSLEAPIRVELSEELILGQRRKPDGMANVACRQETQNVGRHI
jgi:hypothetical protein